MMINNYNDNTDHDGEINLRLILNDTVMFIKSISSYSFSTSSAVQPTKFHTIVTHWLEDGLQDLSVSRQRERLGWGIPVPDDPTQTVSRGGVKSTLASLAIRD